MASAGTLSRRLFEIGFRQRVGTPKGAMDRLSPLAILRFTSVLSEHNARPPAKSSEVRCSGAIVLRDLEFWLSTDNSRRRPDSMLLNPVSLSMRRDACYTCESKTWNQSLASSDASANGVYDSKAGNVNSKRRL
jgi:hypothetical protein